MPAATQGRPRSTGLDERIVEAARRCFARDGYAGTSIQAIAQEASLGKPAIYRRFSGKEPLATRCLEAQAVGQVRIRTANDIIELLATTDRLGWLGDALAARSPTSPLAVTYSRLVTGPIVVSAVEEEARIVADFLHRLLQR
jgi:AcrR family transcriptional regulator